MKIAVVGTGYVGLVAGACLAESGNDVVCVDKDDDKVRMLRRGKMPFYEPGLEELVRRNRSEGRLDVHVHAAESRPRVGRHLHCRRHAAGRRRLRRRATRCSTVARDIAKAMNGYKVIVDKSTVPVGHERSRPRSDPPRNDAPVQRRQQPRVPQAGCRRRRLHEARPRRHWRRGSAGRRADARSSTARSRAPARRSW